MSKTKLYPPLPSRTAEELIFSMKMELHTGIEVLPSKDLLLGLDSPNKELARLGRLLIDARRVRSIARLKTTLKRYCGYCLGVRKWTDRFCQKCCKYTPDTFLKVTPKC